MEKRGQAQIITTVLLILIAIGAIAFVSVFIFNLVSENLGGTECFKTVAQFEIKSGDEGATCFDGADALTVTIQRGQNADFNLTALSITAGDEQTSKTFSQTADLPGPSEKRTYTVDISSAGVTTVNTVTVTPIIGKDKACQEGKTTKQVSICTA